MSAFAVAQLPSLHFVASQVSLQFRGMADEQPSISGQHAGVETRASRRERSSRQTPGGRPSGSNLLTSPTNQLDAYFAPRKSQRLAGRPSKVDARQPEVSDPAPALTGYLGSIPEEVRQFGRSPGAGATGASAFRTVTIGDNIAMAQ